MTMHYDLGLRRHLWPKDDGTGNFCTSVFPRKDNPGPCMKCKLLANLEEGSLEYQRKLGWIQCAECGAVAPRMSDKLCGMCRQAVGLVHESVATATALRSEAFQARMKSPTAGRAPRLLSQGPAAQDESIARFAATPTMPMTTETLNAARRNRTNGETNSTSTATLSIRNIWLQFMARLTPKKLEQRLGSRYQSYPEDMMMEDIIEEVIQGWNPTWIAKYPQPLLRQDVNLRLKDNKEPIMGSSYSTLADFFRAHTTGDKKDIYVGKLPKVSGVVMKGPFMALKLFIDLDLYNARIDVEPTTSMSTVSKAVTPASRKRGAHENMPPPDYIPSKRARNDGGGIPKSSFSRLSTATATVDAVTSVKLTLATTVVDNDSGEIDVSWADDEGNASAKIGTMKMAAGRTKNVYKMILNGKTFVAKRFFDVGKGENTVLPSENYQNLYHELWRAKVGQWFLDRFYHLADAKGVDVDKAFCFTEAYTAKEVPAVSGGYSAASGVTDEGVDADPEPEKAGAYWFLEPRRAQSVRKWTGTMNHSDRNLQGRQGMTIAAFSHFVFEYSNYEVVIADIQSTPTIVGNNMNPSLVIFDIMTHTPESNSGVGDHGQLGIDAFISQHICNAKCESLGLRACAVVRRKNRRSQPTVLDDEDSIYESDEEPGDGVVGEEA
ncbi:kinase-like domain-containing protein [Amylostereum chailletii]|nr:kinase-like domain-containing protein [Amylostereum chailletii]